MSSPKPPVFRQEAPVSAGLASEEPASDTGRAREAGLEEWPTLGRSAPDFGA
jgi:hypothetical protein